MRMASKQFPGYPGPGPGSGRSGGGSAKFEEDKQSDFSNELNRLRVLSKFDQELKNNISSLNNEMHEQRLKNLRELSEKLKENSWKYQPVDKLLGL